jgi:glutamyl-Q tRNA(Asp) synthetase
VSAPQRIPYVGRFAPSPSGPLHFGSLLAAVASYLQARQAGGRWLLRIEDIDPPREQPGSDKLILHALETYGFEWDGPVSYQSSFHENHMATINTLLVDNHAYPCSCSRRDLATAAIGPLGAIYPGTCRNGCDAGETALRVRTNDETIEFEDRLQGHVRTRLKSDSGDFIIRRRDGLVAYHLAVVRDDADQGITEVVRGIDLLETTPRHIHLQNLLGIPTPAYVHIPVAENSDGQKLSKLTGAPPIPTDEVRATLFAALVALGQKPPAEMSTTSLTDIWRWAINHWRLSALKNKTTIAPQHYC